jgi:hypothetical protein
MKENFQFYGELGNEVRRRVPLKRTEFNSGPLEIVDYEFESGKRYPLPGECNSDSVCDNITS